MNRSDILMYGWELPPNNSGGLGVACYGMAKSLAQSGLNISFALPRKLRANLDFMKVFTPFIEGVEITAINADLRPYLTQETYLSSRKYSRNYNHGYSIYDEALRYGQAGASWSNTRQFKIIHAHDWMTFPAAMQTKKASGKPWIAHVHATEFDRTGGNVDQRIAEIEYQGLQSADKIIAVSNYTKNVIHERYSVPNEKISVVHNGVDPVEFDSIDVRRMFPQDNIVLYVGRLTFQKGVDYLLFTAKQVLQTHPQTVFIIAGTGDQEHSLIMQSASMGIGHRIIFAGHLRGLSLKSLYHIADVFVMPSISEPYGLVALEAIANGTPAIISKQSGVAETINNVAKVDFWDTQKMAQQIRHVFDFPQQAKELNRLARMEARKLSWGSAASKIIDVYKTLSA